MELVDIMEMSMVVYMALNTITGKVYIGRTVKSLKERTEEHKCYSKKGNGYFQKSIRKHGWDAFEWSVLEQCETEEELNEMEYHYIFQYKHFGRGVYNLTDGGDGVSGFIHSEETRRKIGNSNRGRVVSEETRKKMRDGNRGRVRSDAIRKKMREAQLGKTHSEETKKKIREANLGKTHSEETRKKMREAQLGKTHSEETKKKMREAQLGNTYRLGANHTEETKQKMSESGCKFTYKITRPDGTIDITKNLTQYCKQYNLHQGCMSRVASGKQLHHKGFKCWKIENAPEPIEHPIPEPIYDHNIPVFDVFF